ncbi:hypothetical protein RDI58_010588 [Solanum bulbocastanum]|uniref:Uncharacterized protein n=1 Tax=Solanum bulbocastanum TaxID=147425 RepID=A0AAN8TU69_SOLBU
MYFENEEEHKVFYDKLELAQRKTEVVVQGWEYSSEGKCETMPSTRLLNDIEICIQ